VAQASLTPDQQMRIQAATFEVVIPKPVDDPLTYERKLPLELEPFQSRNDKYFSIGTAFALGDHRFATAAHVLNAMIGSQFKGPAVRDAQGRVFPIDQILKYSVDQDFAEFSLQGDPGGAALPVNPKPSINSVVYAVGNALGTGVVVRDGLYTSDTPEEQDGRWKWMRFSAAASPGNSGGPLLDDKARVIGIVLRKSPNENLNFALPIQRLLDAPDHLASADARQSYQLDIFNKREVGNFKLALTLPLPFDQFSAAILEAHDAFSDQQLASLLKDNADTLFPNGKGSNKVLQGLWSGDTPGLIQENDNGEWNHYVPESISKTDLGHNGHISFGAIKNNLLVHLRRPDDVSAEALYGDPRRMMDLLLQALSLKRNIGPEQIRITSLGTPVESSVFVDHYGRRWQVARWLIPYSDHVVLVFALPVPDGYAIMLRVPQTGQTHMHLADLRAMTDFVYPNYVGTLAQWRDYLKAAEPLLPTPLRNVDLDIGDGRRFRFKSARLVFELPPTALPISDQSRLELDLSYFRDHGQAVWDAAGIESFEDAHTNTGVMVIRHSQPSDDMEESYANWWDKIRLRRHPFDSVDYQDGDVTHILATQKTPSGADQSFYYSIEVRAEGAPKSKVMHSRLDDCLKGLTVLERTP
jgi:hypothetical protein